ncbi:MAG: biopolymer transporter ExbD [Kiritimatiellae bacterium]|nr:biopolymer transporter ExbD [Kiritimatiellia bacterium]
MSRRKRVARLELTALMDVMLLVLAFFIYSIFDMTVRKGVKVDLPRGAGEPEPGERIVITVKPGDGLQFNGEDMARDAVLDRVAALKRSGADIPVIIAADRCASMGAGVELLAALKEAGVDKVSCQIEDPPTEGVLR